MTTKVLRVRNYGQTTPEYVEINVTDGKMESVVSGITLSGSGMTIDASGSSFISNWPTNQVVSGSPFISNFPANQVVSGSPFIANLPANQVVSGSPFVANFPANQIISGSPYIANLPANQIVSGSPFISGSPITLDGGPAWTVKHGIMSGSAGPWTAYKSGSGGATAGSAFVTDSPTAGQKLVVMDLLFCVDTAMTLTFFTEGDYVNSAIGPFYSLSPGIIYQITLRGNPYKLPTADKRLVVLSSVAGNIMVDPDYYSIPT